MKPHNITSILVSSLIAFSAFADDHEGKDFLSPFNVIGTKSDISDLKGSGYVIDESDLGPFMHTDINDILRQVPGVYVRPEEGYGFFPNISLRGVDPKRSNKITIMEDGIPSSPAPIADPAGYYAPTAGRMAGFEILKGPSSLKHGPSTTGGVINYLSTPIPNEQKSKIRGSFGTFNERVAHAYSGGKLDFAGGQLGYLLEVFEHSSDGFKDIASLNGAPTKNAPISRSDLLIKLCYESENGHYLEFKAGRMDMDADVSYQGVSLADFKANPYLRYAGTEHDNMDADQTRYYLRYRKELTDTMGISATLFHNEFNRNWYKGSKVSIDGTNYTSVGKGVFQDANLIGVLKGDTNGTYKVKSNNRAYEAQGIMANLDFSVGNNEFDLGFRFMTNDYDQLPYHEDTFSVVNDGAGTTTTTKKYGPKPGNTEYKDADSFEVYLTDDISFGSLTVSPGIRYTSIDYQYSGANDRTLSETLAGIGAGYEVSESLNLFAGVYQGQTFPDAQSASTAKNYNQETSLNFEIGARGNIGIFGFDVTYFNTQLEDMLFLESVASGVTQTYNGGEGSIQGLELALGADFGNEGFGFPVSISATFTDSEFETSADGFSYDFGDDGVSGNEAGNEFAYIPDTMFNIRAGLEFDKFSTYLNYFHQSDIFTNADNTDEYKLDSYGLLNWSGFVKVNDSATLFTKVTNLTDEVYAHGIAPDGYRPGAPRIVSVGMEFDF
jgi:Fe(3+) dicitrate transport protein